MRALLLGPIALLAVFLVPPVSAHEFWIAPSTFAPDAGDLVQVHLLHGERFAGTPVARQTSMIKRFTLVDGDGETKVVGRSGAAVSLTRAADDDLQVLVYESNHLRNDLTAERFEAYLREEGLDRIVSERAQRGESSEAGREVYQRCAKALLRSPDATGDEVDRVLGLPLELVRLPDAADGSLRAQLLYRGAPLADAGVVLVHEQTPGDLRRLTTDTHGCIETPAARGGTWMLTSIHMTRVADPDRLDAEWESFWASLTFQR
ncbi:MAG: DUF4198 domain-containing protein [Phycisphaerales bacterium]|nr:DUF4198 domain-containing protein [Phycisphaerae bacterium]NNF41938.1 DUF4198 domain-containing protein [Phycisphaerales bacterium]NNM27312.1 DUF4198 domain-containing protein [Phycisphaerales bacterium]